jgi:DNA-binding NarL/FixJ family response regulator
MIEANRDKCYKPDMAILIAEDNPAQRYYLQEILTKQFDLPIIQAENGEIAINLTLEHKPTLCILDIQMPQLSGVKAAKTIWSKLPETKIIFWTQFPHEIYINEIRKIIKDLKPTPTYGFIHKNNPEPRLLRFIATVLEDNADVIDPAFKDSFKRPLLTDFEGEALRYLSLGLSNWAIARKCSLSQRGVESRLATLYEKLNLYFEDGYEKFAFNVRTRAFCEALKRGLINSDELEKAELELQGWFERDRAKFLSEKPK